MTLGKIFTKFFKKCMKLEFVSFPRNYFLHILLTFEILYRKLIDMNKILIYGVFFDKFDNLSMKFIDF